MLLKRDISYSDYLKSFHVFLLNVKTNYTLRGSLDFSVCANIFVVTRMNI